MKTNKDVINGLNQTSNQSRSHNNNDNANDSNSRSQTNQKPTTGTIPPASTAGRPSCGADIHSRARFGSQLSSPSAEYPATSLQPITSAAEPKRSEGRFTLRKGLGAWELSYNDQTAILKHEVGLDYVSFLMDHPGEEFHGLALALKVRALREGHAPDSVDLIQERALALDDAEAARRIYRKQLELEALIDDELTIEAVRDEAYGQLKDILTFQKKNVAKTSNQASRASHSVAKAIKRLHQRLANAVTTAGRPHLLLRHFARHIRNGILIPSGRGTPGGTRPVNSGGYFIFTDLTR